jgi:hypothetical protein
MQLAEGAGVCGCQDFVDFTELLPTRLNLLLDSQAPVDRGLVSIPLTAKWDMLYGDCWHHTHPDGTPGSFEMLSLFSSIRPLQV